MISRSIYNLKIDTICICDIPLDRSILQLSNCIRHVMPSTDRMLELTAKHRWLSHLTAGCEFPWVNVSVCCVVLSTAQHTLTHHKSTICRQIPITHITSTCETLYVISTKYRLSLPDEGSYVIRNMLE
jgi:hypothetical protein